MKEQTFERIMFNMLQKAGVPTTALMVLGRQVANARNSLGLSQNINITRNSKERER